MTINDGNDMVDAKVDGGIEANVDNSKEVVDNDKVMVDNGTDDVVTGI